MNESTVSYSQNGKHNCVSHNECTCVLWGDLASVTKVKKTPISSNQKLILLLSEWSKAIA